MATIHPVYFQDSGDGKVIVATVLDKETLGFKDKDEMVFMIATTSRDPLSKNLQIILDKKTKTSSDEYVRIINEANGPGTVEPTRGMGINGILRSPYWFLKKTKTFLEQYYGG
jgi:hypothetical protein